MAGFHASGGTRETRYANVYKATGTFCSCSLFCVRRACTYANRNIHRSPEKQAEGQHVVVDQPIDRSPGVA